MAYSASTGALHQIRDSDTNGLDDLNLSCLVLKNQRKEKPSLRYQWSIILGLKNIRAFRLRHISANKVDRGLIMGEIRSRDWM